MKSVSGISHGFGTRTEPVPGIFAPRWESRASWQQVHGIAIAEIGEPKQSCGEVDALYTRQSGIPVAVMTADCVPILLARQDGGAVAAVHAGWRGTEARIIRALWKKLNAQGEKPADWVAAIGPAIGPCCYEVSEELAEKFAQTFASHGAALAVPSHRHLDLPAINQAELKDLGLAQVDLLRQCTLCSKNPEYFSYRRDGKGTRQWSVVMIGQP